MSLEGTIAGALAALLVALVALIPRPLIYGPVEIIAVVLAAVIGSFLESIAGALLSSRGVDVDNHALNLGNTIAGGLIAAHLGMLFA